MTQTDTASSSSPESGRTSTSRSIGLLVVRLAGLWIFLGGVAKWLFGAPGDLPRFLWDLPIERATLFPLVISFEMALGLFAFLRPTRGWLPIIPVYLAFVAVLLTQIASGATSCGCIGSQIPVPPWLMLSIDLVWLGLILFVARPWRWGRRALRPLPLLLPLVLLAAACPWIYSRTASADDPSKAGIAWVEPSTWKGKRFEEIDIYKWFDKQDIEPTALYLLYVESCEVCAEHLDLLYMREQGERTVYLMKVWEKDASEATRKVHKLPSAPYIEPRELREGVPFSVTPPVEIDVRDGKVVRVMEAGEELP